MLPASNRGSGMNIGFPDPCATPPMGVPIPYPNLATHATATPFAVKTFFSFVNGLNMGSIIPLTNGDQAGTMSPFMGPSMATMGNPRIFVEALPALNLLCPTTGNNMINGLGAILMAAVTNVFFSLAGAAPPSDVGDAALSALSRALVPFPGDEVDAMLPEGVAYARISVFSTGVPSRIHDVIRRRSGEGMSALILDLRGCPGGDLTAALSLSGDFLPEGALVATVVDADGDETVYRARRERPHTFPLVLLVDRHTASAAEVFAGAMKAHGRALVIGERTWGKGTVQQLLPGAAEPGAAYATVATVKLPDGELLDGRGVDPDLEEAC